jgi:transcriptional regulator with XRE-family HTH domain
VGRRPADLARLGEVIRHFRLDAGLTQEGLADRAGLHRTYIGGVERGERNVSFLTLGRILRAAGITWSRFARALDGSS